MKVVSAIVFVLMGLLVSSSVSAYDTFGEVNRYLSYDYIEISGREVCGMVKNETSKRVYMFTDILFMDRDSLINKAKLHIKVQPDGEGRFCEYLDYGNTEATEDALFVKWDVYMLELNGKKVISGESIY